MGNPQFRFTLSHAINGTLEITEPINWQSAILKLERHEDFHSLVEYFEGAFTFYGSDGGNINGGIEWIKSTEFQFGFDTEIIITIEVSFDEGETFESIFVGQLDLTGAQELKDNKMEIPIIRNSLWSNFISRQDVPVNIQSTTDLDGNSIYPINDVTINLISQKINKKFDGHIINTQPIIGMDNSAGIPYAQIDFDKEILSEINTKYNYSIASSETVPFELFTMDEDGSYIIDCKLCLGLCLGGTDAPESAIGILKVYLQINGDDPVEFTETDRDISSYFPYTDNYGRVVSLGYSYTITDYTYSNTITLKKTDSIRIYIQALGTTDNEAYTHIYSYDGSKHITITGGIGEGSYYAGVWNPSSTLFPVPPTGVGYYILYEITQDGTLQGVPVKKDWVIITNNTNTPGQDPANWLIGAKSIYEGLRSFGSDSYLTVNGGTTLIDTNCDGFLLHDVSHAICDRITGQVDSFYSEILGSNQTSINYPSDGCFWKHILVQGLQIRGYYLSTKQFSIAFSKWWQGANPIFNLGLGYDTIEGVEKIRCEEKSFFYDSSSVSVYIDNVREIIREYDTTRIFNHFEFGYDKWESEDISGIDDPQTKRTWYDIIKKIKNTLTLYSKFIAASYAIETTRRSTIEKSADNKYDNEVFIIAITGDSVSPDRYSPQLNEDFSEINNLFNPETRYNLTLTPLRNILRWGNYVTICLQKYLSSYLKFTSGEGNYAMESNYSGDSCIGVLNNVLLNEKYDIPVSILTPLHLPDLFTITIDLSWDDYLAIRNNRTKAIGVSQTESNHKKFFIKSLEYTICQSKAKIIMWAAETVSLQIVDVAQLAVSCDTPNLRITEDSLIRITEDGIDRRV